MFKEKPAKASIASAQYFTDQMLELVQGTEDLAQWSEFDVAFALDMRPELPLHGHEPHEFIIEFARLMIQEKERCERTLARLEDVKNIPAVYEPAQKRYERYNAAAIRAIRILKDY